MGDADKSWAAQRAARIRQDIPIVDVLADYGYAVRADGGDREQQFSCNLHGTGFDTKPSARVYPESQSWYCFGCDLSRTSIETVMENDGIAFWPAVRILEQRYNLPLLEWAGSTEKPTLEILQANLQQGQIKTFSDTVERYQRLLDVFTRERDIPLLSALVFWEAFDKVVWHVEKARWTEAVGQKVLGELLDRLKVALR